MSSNPLLDGITVLNLASVGPAARAGRWLADYGADVVQIGPTSRKGAVQIKPPFFSYSAGRGLKRAQIDLKDPQGLEAFLRLASEADVIIESFRPGVAARIGIGYDAVRRLNERVVYCATSGYGQAGPYSQWAGHDINYLAIGGFLDCTTPRQDGGQPIPGATVADSAAGGMQAVVAILAALLHRERSGEGQFLDVCVADAVLSLMSQQIDEYLAIGTLPGPGSNILTGRYACYDCYPARDGGWVSVGVVEPHFFANLCRALDLEHFIPYQHDDDRQDEIRAAFREKFLTKDRDTWVAELAPASCCVAPVYSVPEVVEDEHYRARGVWLEAEDEEHGRFRQLAPTFGGAWRDQALHRVREGTDTAALLARAGYARDEIDKLLEAGAVE